MRQDNNFFAKLEEQRHLARANGFGDFYKEDLPINKKISQTLIKESVNNSVVNYVERPLDGKNGISLWLNDNKIVLTVEGKWSIYLKNNIFVSSSDKDVEIEERIKRNLVGLEVLDFNYNDNSMSTTIEFSSEIKLVVNRDEDVEELWYFIDRKKSYVISLDNFGHFFHTITCPESLKKHYLFEKNGQVVANILYALDFYRKLIK